MQARQSLQAKVGEVFQQGRSPFDRRALRSKVMAALPLLTLVEAARPIWWWGGLLRRALPAAYAAAAGLVGGLIYYEVQAEQLTMDAGLKTAEGTITVRLHQAPVMAGEAVVDAGGRLYPPCAPSGSQLGDLTGGDG